MKVLQQGVLQEETYLLICHEDAHVAEYSKEEVTYENKTLGPLVICPVCNQWRIVLKSHPQESIHAVKTNWDSYDRTYGSFR